MFQSKLNLIYVEIRQNRLSFWGEGGKMLKNVTSNLFNLLLCTTLCIFYYVFNWYFQMAVDHQVEEVQPEGVELLTPVDLVGAGAPQTLLTSQKSRLIFVTFPCCIRLHSFVYYHCHTIGTNMSAGMDENFQIFI